MYSFCTNINVKPVNQTESRYIMPAESETHEGTWLQWPHHYQYGINYRKRIEATWIAITKELISCEKIHIIAYNNEEKNRIIKLLKNNNIDLTNIDFKIYETDDVWIRDNGPVYVRDRNKKLVIEDWGFNGWGKKANYQKCNKIPSEIAKEQNRELINLNNELINEGGSVEIDGNGTLMACKSSILNNNRNPEITQKEAEKIFTKYLGVSYFIWLDGQKGVDITDSHIDGFARFGNEHTIVTMSKEDLSYYYVKNKDIDKLYHAKDKNGNPYHLLILPLTKKDVITSYGKNVGRASYCNFYIANTKVLVPIYHDQNDSIALNKIYLYQGNKNQKYFFHLFESQSY